jgi:hypothetical protein
MFYYWVNFAPITRGTSATGYAALLGVILTMGEEPADPIPRMTQYDWVAMFTPHPQDFVATGLLWLGNLRPTTVNTELLSPHVPLSSNYRDSKCKNSEDSVNQQDIEMEMDIDGSPIIKNEKFLADQTETSSECADHKSFLKMRVGDVFDSMSDVVTAMNCLGERRYDDPLLVV